MSTPNLGITHIAANQTQKEVTANAAFDSLDTAMTDSFSFDATAGGILNPTAASVIAAFTLKFTGTLPGNTTINVPSNKKSYRIHHAATGAFTITVKVAGQIGVVLQPGDIRLVYCNGTDIVQGDSYAAGAELTTHKDAVNGYAGLDASGFLKAAEENMPRDARTTTTEAVVNTDRAKLVTFNNAAATAATIAQAGTGGLFADGWFAFLFNRGAGVVTLTPATSTVNGGTTLALSQNQGCMLVSDGANYIALPLGKLKGTVDLLTQAANVGATALLAVPAGQGGLYRVSVFAVITQAATTSCTLPNIALGYTEKDSNAALTPQVAASTSTNVVGTLLQSVTIVNAKEGTSIQVSTSGYASSGATPMQYAFHAVAQRVA